MWKEKNQDTLKALAWATKCVWCVCYAFRQLRKIVGDLEAWAELFGLNKSQAGGINLLKSKAELEVAYCTKKMGGILKTSVSLDWRILLSNGELYDWKGRGAG